MLSPSLARLVVRATMRAVADGSSASRVLRTLLAVERDVGGLIDEVAMRYGDGVHVKHRLTGYHDFFVERVNRGERVLDIGCGYGAVAYSVATRADAVVVGVDLDPANIDAARRRFPDPRLTFIVGDATRDVPNGPFDVVIASNVVEHLADRVAFYQAVQAALRPSRWLVRVPLVDRDWKVSLRRELGLPYFSDPTHHVEYTRSSFEDEVAAARLCVRELRVNWGEIWAEVFAPTASSPA